MFFFFLFLCASSNFTCSLGVWGRGLTPGPSDQSSKWRTAALTPQFGGRVQKQHFKKDEIHDGGSAPHAEGLHPPLRSEAWAAQLHLPQERSAPSLKSPAETLKSSPAHGPAGRVGALEPKLAPLHFSKHKASLCSWTKLGLLFYWLKEQQAGEPLLRARMLSHIWLVTAPPFMEFSRQESWSGLPFPSPGDLPDPGIKPASPVSPSLQVDSLLLSHQGGLNLCWDPIQKDQ